MIGLGTQAVTASHDAMIQFCSATRRTGAYQYITKQMADALPGYAFPGAQKPTISSKDCSVQCSLLTRHQPYVEYDACIDTYMYTLCCKAKLNHGIMNCSDGLSAQINHSKSLQ